MVEAQQPPVERRVSRSEPVLKSLGKAKHKKFKEENLAKVRQNTSNTALAPAPDNDLQAAAEEAMRDHRMNRVGPQDD